MITRIFIAQQRDRGQSCATLSFDVFLKVTAQDRSSLGRRQRRLMAWIGSGGAARWGLAWTSLAGAVMIAAAAVAQPSPVLEALPFDKKVKLARAGDEEAQMAVANAYATGEGVKKSPIQAARWYRLAAQRGNAEAQFRLARIVHVGARGLDRNPELAAQLYEAAARQGHHEAEYWAGYVYETGEGVEKDAAKAIDYYRKAADAGEASAQNNLGLIYLNGKDVARDLTEAFRLFKEAAAKDDPWAQNNLGGMYEMGWGIAADRAEAVRLYRLAAARGNPHAITNLKRLGEAVETPANAQN
jgi:TPR repeat protein